MINCSVAKFKAFCCLVEDTLESKRCIVLFAGGRFEADGVYSIHVSSAPDSVLRNIKTILLNLLKVQRLRKNPSKHAVL